MIIKVCGLKEKVQIEQLDRMDSVNWLGSIFYEKSVRYVKTVSVPINNSKSVGVFVNENLARIEKIAEENNLDYLQLHGDETPEDCFKLKGNYKIIKAFGIDELFDFTKLRSYEKAVDYFLFDTKTLDYGGSGKLFDWNVLQKYELNIPFLLSGGINLNSVDAIKQFNHPSFVGIDLNSGFEIGPANKNIELIQQFTNEFKK